MGQYIGIYRNFANLSRSLPFILLLIFSPFTPYSRAQDLNSLFENSPGTTNNLKKDDKNLNERVPGESEKNQADTPDDEWANEFSDEEEEKGEYLNEIQIREKMILDLFAEENRRASESKILLQKGDYSLQEFSKTGNASLKKAAWNYYEKAFSITPEIPEIRFKAARAFFDQGKYFKAYDCLYETDRCHFFSETYFLMAQIQTALNRPEMALKSYNTATNHDHNNSLKKFILNNRANLYFKTGKLAKAESEIRDYLKIQKKDGDAERLLALIAFSRHEFKKAKKQLLKSLSIENDHPLSLYYLTLTAIQMRHRRDAIRYSRRLKKIDPVMAKELRQFF